MYRDKWIAQTRRSRTARGWSNDVLFDAWSGYGDGRGRAAVAAGEGDLVRAAAASGDGWEMLLRGDLKAALDCARKEPEAPGMGLLEAHVMLSLGAITAGLQSLAGLAAIGDGPATLSLAREFHKLGHHRAALSAVKRIPENAHAILVGARAALALEQPGEAWKLVAPVLDGTLDAPNPATSGACAVVAGEILARWKQHRRLRAFADRLGAAGDLPEEMWAPTARVAWMAGLGESAWKRFDIPGHPAAAAAHAELAVLAGNARLARGKTEAAGLAAAPTKVAVAMLEGTLLRDSNEAQELSEDARIHVWRTHPCRWDPWIAALKDRHANLFVADLSRDETPSADEVPQAVFDDGALAEFVPPKPVAARAAPGKGVWIEERLCEGVGIGHDWPADASEALSESVERASDPADAAVRICSATKAFSYAGEGLPCIVIAPPGDPFWNGPIPAQAWPSLRVFRADARRGWRDAAERVRTLLADAFEEAA